jgi:hypothetical protein
MGFAGIPTNGMALGLGSIISLFPGSRFPPILDQLGVASAAAYSLRRLRAAYTGSAIPVRRSSDNDEADIGFTANGDLDTASLLAFVGSGDGFATAWYDQSGNGVNAPQTTAASQPRIVSNGVIETQNGGQRCFSTAAPFLITQYPSADQAPL